MLARDQEDYDSYCSQIRREYAHVPDEAFASGRAAALRSLVRAPRLYRTEWFHRELEAKARANVEREIAQLEQQEQSKL